MGHQIIAEQQQKIEAATAMKQWVESTMGDLQTPAATPPKPSPTGPTLYAAIDAYLTAFNAKRHAVASAAVRGCATVRDSDNANVDEQ
jgi:hypothetical protein